MDTAPKIAVFVTQHMPSGGIESHLKEFCYQLKNAGAVIDLVISNSAMLPDAEAFYKSVCRNVYLGNGGKSKLRFLWLALVGLKLSFKKYDALYTNGQGESVMLFASLLNRRKTWVHHHHTAGDKEDQHTWGPSYYKALASANSVIACSGRNASDLRHALNRQIKSIPCFSRSITAADKTISQEKLRFGYYGRLIPEKGINLLCKLSSDQDLSYIEFNIWGEGEAYPKSFFNSFPSLKYNGAFSSAEELAAVINSLDAFLLLSTHPEGLPISLLEAMSAGLPWLATKRGGIPDIALDEMSARLMDNCNDYEEVKAAIQSLALDIMQGRVLRKNQIDLYKKKFSAPVLVGQWKQEFGLRAN